MKKGVTLISIVIYLVLFFTFTVFATSVSSNINRNVFMDKGSVEVEKEYSKLYINMFSSAKESELYYIVQKQSGTNINFSNGDSYLFDLDNGIIYKNEGILIENLKGFSIIKLEESSNTNLSSEVLKKSESLCFKVSFEKYDQFLERQIVVTVGDE